MATFSLDDMRAVCKGRDAWWTVFLVDPVAIRLALPIANRTSITPNQLTAVAFAFGLAAAGCFALAAPGWLALGALLYHVGFVVDCMDGKIARLKGTGTTFGAWLDFMLDRVRDSLCAVALTGGQYARTGQVAYLYAGMAVLALDMFRYVNGPQIVKARRAMRTATAAARRRAAAVAEGDPRMAVLGGQGHRVVTLGGGEGRVEEPEAEFGRTPHPDPHYVFDTRWPWYRRIRQGLLRRRVRTHLVSGIEFQMSVFILGPLTGAIIPIIVVTGALLVFFELVIIYKFWLSTRAHTRLLAVLEAGSRPVTDPARSPLPR
ncbi:CDP-alcohol phosphatidyltransferase [Thermomonospora echinospora]|uniref:CDP-alcohol phosphatidyltransferase n=1 Tax=Thermomonospora echinospora TaxID=1992 RepID=A0A1H5ZFC6_9ACTN|nr:CDP-alcohol phosphatidyltransferase family protein [Thermomonospora echinospora]SEG34327.1 CDP-alcohol phosphatidyltransferase [Thermomonospora echinospora]